MGYVAIKGGEDAIANAAVLTEFFRLRDRTDPLTIEQIRNQFRLLIDKIMGEGSVYAPEHAAIALKQVEGDVFESAFILRAFRATLKRNYHSEVVDTLNAFVERRISSIFREIPGGQILGPTRDYTHRLLEDESEPEEKEPFCGEATQEYEALPPVQTFSRVIDLLSGEGLLRPVSEKEDRRLVDITREAIKFPAPRSARMQMLARSETGGLACMAYSSQRGFGPAHASVGELRVLKARIEVTDSRGRKRCIGRIRLTEAHMVCNMQVRGREPVPYLSLGYGLCFGQNEVKAISMGILDRTMRDEGDAPSQSQEFVLYHTEGVESYGFTNHLKLPHYVTFQSGLNNLRQAVERKEREREAFTVGSTRREEPKR
jgi:alpha-D-ribose 1-methylphosphonate 5-triphosphate synthase subunit PhnI